MRPKYNFTDVAVMLVSPDRQMNITLNGILHDNGFRNVFICASVEALNDHLGSFSPALIICDMILKDGNLGNVIHQIRHNELGGDPFIPIIAMCSEPTPDDPLPVGAAPAGCVVRAPRSHRVLPGRAR